MNKLNFDVTMNSSDFIDKTEQVRFAIRATALEMEQQGQKIGSSFQQMADGAGITADFMRNVVSDMHDQINGAIASLGKIDLENQFRLSKLQEVSVKKNFGESIQTETNSRESLSVNINSQYIELSRLNFLKIG